MVKGRNNQVRAFTKTQIYSGSTAIEDLNWLDVVTLNTTVKGRMIWSPDDIVQPYLGVWTRPWLNEIKARWSVKTDQMIAYLSGKP